MVVANKIPREGQDRLRFWGMTFKEIPESEFVSIVGQPSSSDDLTQIIPLPEAITRHSDQELGKRNSPAGKEEIFRFIPKPPCHGLILALTPEI
jgi:hypothetical protein